MARQLTLINPTQVDWRLDERTKVGRRGISEARAALRRATPPITATTGAGR